MLSAPSDLEAPTTQHRGTWAEGLALQHLQTHGLEPLERNYRCRLGEIDLVMREGRTIVFVEVRYRRREYFGSGAETVGYRKRQRLIRAAQHYLQDHGRLRNRPCRFDVVSITAANEDNAIQWIRHAFET